MKQTLISQIRLHDIPHHQYRFSYTRFPVDNGLAKKDHVCLDIEKSKKSTHTRT